ncbi:TetR/AcrR family transcriptional regulator [Streptomyces sp. MMG1121]|uniref:TetR/AcrR family transcriptional regulator n=1 Tax=Streptomyces sp. MMG1121 TaxID=1415544 RepID=UPI0006C6896A|nr:TetR/AcrR family transcriptional regulator [Streptomyces sp. MMG1121]KOV62016.1 hypothetical protein ADK64_26850 [Streptomyces sp. MMG1121]
MARPRGFDVDEVLSAVMELFWRQGYEATSVQDLCAATGLGKGSLYAAFGSKQELYAQALRHYVKLTTHDLQAQLLRSVPLRQAVRDLLLDRIDQSLSTPERPGCLLVSAVVERVPHDHGAARIARDAIEALKGAFAAALHAARAAGEISADADVDSLAGFLTAMVQALRVMSISVPDEKQLTSIVDTALSVIPE